MNMKHSVPVPFVSGDDENYMSDGLPLDEKEDFAFEEHRRCTLVGIKLRDDLELATESVPKLKNKKKEVIVDVQEVEVDEHEDLDLQRIDPIDDAFPYQSMKMNVIDENEQEVESPIKIQQKKNLKVDTDKADNIFEHAADVEAVNIPTINFIDTENVKHLILDEDVELIDQDHEKIKDEQKRSINEHENPDHCKNQEELEKLKHADDHTDKRRLSVDLIVEHPEVFKHNSDSGNNNEHGNEVEHLNNEQIDETHINQENNEHEVENEEELQILSKDTMKLIGKASEDPNAEEDDEVKENDENFVNSDQALDPQDSPVWGDGEEEYANFENTADEENKDDIGDLAQQEFDNKALELLEKADALKKEGNDFFQAKDYAKARSKYSRVFAYTKGIAAGQPDGGDEMTNMATKIASRGNVSEDIKIRATNLERDVNSNMAMVYLNEENWHKVIEKATASISIDPSPKAYFRRGKAHAMKNDFESAYKDLEIGKSLR